MRKLLISCISLVLLIPLHGQNERKAIREGVKAYEGGNYAEAEVEFRKAESFNGDSYEAEFNTGTALYGQKKYEETVSQYETLLSETEDARKEAQIWHNIGNSLLEAQQYGPSIEAYKNSLRRAPEDDDTRYNLAYAKEKLREQQEQQRQDEQNKDQQEDQGENEKKDQQQDQQQDQGENENKDQQNEEQQEQNADRQEDDPQEQQNAPREISREDAERMLKAIQQQERDVKEKVDKEKAAAAKVKTEKDW